MRFVVQKEEEEPLRCLQGNHRRATVQFRVLADRGAPIPRPQRGGIPRQLLVVPLICQEPWLRAKEQEGATPEVIKAVREYVDFFNKERPSFALDYLTPTQYKERYWKPKLQAIVQNK